MAEVNQAFLNWLAETPQALARFIQLIKEFYAIQGEVVTPPSGTVPSGPTYIRPDKPPTLLTIPITPEELDLMANDRADALVKEKALIFVKAFLQGVVVGVGL